ncbi:hypothetical protein RhiirB3_460703 [Rhizophagus irregularis]|nr:hypothetical protein RhiirB3_460703 [Rhizophagus irregularis]
MPCLPESMTWDFLIFKCSGRRLFVLVLVSSALCCGSFLNTWYSLKLLTAKINKIQAQALLNQKCDL